MPGRAERLELLELLECTPDRARVVYGGERDGRLVGVIAINAARRLGTYRMALADLAAFDELRATVAAAPPRWASRRRCEWRLLTRSGGKGLTVTAQLG